MKPLVDKIITKIKTKFKNNANLQSILILIFWAFASRGLGVVRESLVGRLIPIEADIYNAAATLNETIVTIFILGSVGVAMLPQILKIESVARLSEKKIALEPPRATFDNKSTVQASDSERGSELVGVLGAEHTSTGKELQVRPVNEVNSYISWCLMILSTFIVLICVVGISFNDQILRLINLDFYNQVERAGKLQDYLNLNVIFLIAPVLFAIKTVLGVFLNARKSFKFYSLEGFLGNFGTIVGLSILYHFYGLSGAGFGLSLGFLVVILFFSYDAWRLGLRFNLQPFPALNGYLLQSLFLFLPRLLLISNARVAETLITTTARTAGDISTFRMAMNIQGVFYGLIVAVGTVFLPDLTAILIKNGKSQEFWGHLGKYLQISHYVSFAGVVMTILGAPLILGLIKFLSFSSKSSLLSQNDLLTKIIILIAIGSLSIPLQAVGEILNRYFIATEDRFRAITAAFGGNVCSVIITYFLIQHTEVAYGVMLGFVVNNLILVVILAYFCWRSYSVSHNNLDTSRL